MTPQRTRSEESAPAERPLLRVIIADDDPFAREDDQGRPAARGRVVIGEAQNGRQAVELALHYPPDVVLMDVVMPELDGIAATRRIAERQPAVRSSSCSQAPTTTRRGSSVCAPAPPASSPRTSTSTSLPQALAAALNGEAAI